MIIIYDLLFFFFLIAHTFIEDWRDGLWFYGNAYFGGVNHRDNILWHTLKPLEAILTWLCGAFGGLFLYFGWIHFYGLSDYFTAASAIILNLGFVWIIRVRLHNWFLGIFRERLGGDV